MVLRSIENPCDDFPITLTPEQLSAARQLLDALKEERPIAKCYHRLLFALFSKLPAGTDEDEFRCPILRFLILRCLNKNGIIDAPFNITQHTARLIWNIRTVVLQDALINLDKYANEEQRVEA